MADLNRRANSREETQIYRIEIRFDFTGTREEAEAEAARAAALLGEGVAEVTAIFDEEWNEV